MASTTPSLVDWAAQLINFEIFDEGKRFLGVADVTLPEIEYMSTEISGAGIAGQVSMPSRWITNSLELTLKFRSVTQWATHLLEQQSHDLTMYGAVNSYKSGGAADYASSGSSDIHGKPSSFNQIGQVRAMPVKIAARCLSKKLNLGKFAPNELMESECVFELVTLRVEVDGSEELSLDKFGYILKIHGEDYAADVKSALGLG